MTKRHEAKYKIDRRMGQNVWGRPKSPVNQREYGPGQHGQRRKGKLSDYGVQLARQAEAARLLRQHLRAAVPRHLRRKRIRMKGDSGANLIGLLERRLDAVVYRAEVRADGVRGAPVRQPRPRQGERPAASTIPSYRVKVGDLIEVKEKSKQLALVLEATGLARARRAGLHRGRPLQDDGQAHPHPGARRGALPGADGAASGGRVLFALTFDYTCE